MSFYLFIKKLYCSFFIKHNFRRNFMKNIEKLGQIADKLKKLKNSSNDNVDFIPRQTISVNINSKRYYMSLIADDDFQVKVVLLDDDNNVLQEILSIEGDRGDITKIKNMLYVFTDDDAYIYDVNNLDANPLIRDLHGYDIQGVCANDQNIFAYSINIDKIIMFDPYLNPEHFYDNVYSKENSRSSLKLTCNDSTFFSIPFLPSREEEYVMMKAMIAEAVGSKIADENDIFNSCAYDKDENILYISMDNLVWRIKDGTEFSYLYFKNRNMTTLFYDNDIKRLIVNFGGHSGRHVNGSIVKLSNDDIKERAVYLGNIDPKVASVPKISPFHANQIEQQPNYDEHKKNR